MGAISIGMRRRFDEGGEAGSPLEPQQQGPYAPALAALVQRLNGPPRPAGPQQPRGALNAAVAPAAAPLDDTPGAAAAGVGGQNIDPDAAAKTERIRQAMAILQAGGGVPSERPGAVNLPLLAAAGAMLAPTRTGGFAESLGNSMTAGAGALQQQRQQDETARLREAQQADTAAWRQGMLGVNQQNANTREMSVQAKQWVAERTLVLKAQGMSDTAAYRQALIDARLAGIDSREQIAADNREARSGDVRYRTDARTATEEAKLEAQRARWLKSDTAKAEDQRLRRMGIDSRMINSALLAASRDIQVMTGKKSVQQAVDEWLRAQGAGMQRLQGGSAPPAEAPAPAGAPAGPAPATAGPGAAPPAQQQGRPATANEIAGATAAIKANPANRQIVLDRLRAAGVNPPPGL